MERNNYTRVSYREAEQTSKHITLFVHMVTYVRPESQPKAPASTSRCLKLAWYQTTISLAILANTSWIVCSRRSKVLLFLSFHRSQQTRITNESLGPDWLAACSSTRPGGCTLRVWFPAPLLRPGCAHAKGCSQPGSGGTRESTVSLEPGSDGASARACECAWTNVQTQKFTFALDVQVAKQSLRSAGTF